MPLLSPLRIANCESLIRPQKHRPRAGSCGLSWFGDGVQRARDALAQHRQQLGFEPQVVHHPRPVARARMRQRQHAAGQVRAPAPALPDDVGTVRKLCQMGFSRTQVVRALERCGYRTERALEHLLSNSGRA